MRHEKLLPREPRRGLDGFLHPVRMGLEQLRKALCKTPPLELSGIRRFPGKQYHAQLAANHSQQGEERVILAAKAGEVAGERLQRPLRVARLQRVGELPYDRASPVRHGLLHIADGYLLRISDIEGEFVQLAGGPRKFVVRVCDEKLGRPRGELFSDSARVPLKPGGQRLIRGTRKIAHDPRGRQGLRQLETGVGLLTYKDKACRRTGRTEIAREGALPSPAFSRSFGGAHFHQLLGTPDDDKPPGSHHRELVRAVHDTGRTLLTGVDAVDVEIIAPPRLSKNHLPDRGKRIVEKPRISAMKIENGNGLFPPEKVFEILEGAGVVTRFAEGFQDRFS